MNHFIHQHALAIGLGLVGFFVLLLLAAFLVGFGMDAGSDIWHIFFRRYRKRRKQKRVASVVAEAEKITREAGRAGRDNFWRQVLKHVARSANSSSER